MTKFLCCATAALAVMASAGAKAQTTPRVFHVTAAPTLPGPVSGRLLIFMKQGHGDKQVDIQEFHPADTWVAAQEVHDLAPGASIDIDADTVAYPQDFSHAPAGTWEAQAVLDPDHSYNYEGRAATDWEGPVVALPANGTATLTLERHPETATHTAAKPPAQEQPGIAEKFDFESSLLTRFWGKPTSIRAWIILPPGYKTGAAEKYPTVYWTHGFGGGPDYALKFGMLLRARMEKKQLPPMIWVMLDESIPQGTHEFADSVNNGPWGTALTTECIPALERKYPSMDAKPTGRLLTGHSSGGWATLQLEVNYPQIFGGTWSTSPDPSDFHNFTGTDLYAPNANVYRGANGSATPLMRMGGKVVATFEQFAKVEAVLGPYGGQIASFEWVFSPKGPDGAPEPMFDRTSGAVDPKIVQYWHDHYDLAYDTEQHWAERGDLLKGRIHLLVGTADTFYLDGAAHLFEARLQKLGAEPHFTYVPDRTHFDLFTVGADKLGLMDRIGSEMYAVARPGTAWHPVS